MARWPKLQDLDENLELHRKLHDEEANKFSTPAASERIRQHAVWACECYTPSLVDSLVESLEQFEWVDIGGQQTSTPRDWIPKIRSVWGGSQAQKLGSLAPGARDRMWSGGFRAEAPSGASYGEVWLYQVLPSVTTLTVRIDLDPERMLEYERVLRKTLPSLGKPHGSAIEYVGPEKRKAIEIEDVRRGARALATGWIRTNAPGIFGRDAEEKWFPTAELITTSEMIPFEDESPGAWQRWTSILGIASSWYAWQSGRPKALRLGWPPFGRLPSHLTLAARFPDFVTENELRVQPDDNIAFALMEWGSWMARWALGALLQFYGNGLAVVRDRILAVDIGATESAARGLEADERTLVSLSRDARPFLVDLSAAAASTELARGREYDLFPLKTDDGRGSSELLKSLLPGWNTQATTLLAALDEVRDAVATISSLVSARAQHRFAVTNTYLQWTIVALTLLIVFLTIYSMRR